MGKVRDFLILSFLGILIINITLISAYVIITKYGTVTLNPGEKYTINIPFFGTSKSPEICGKAQKTTGEALQGVNVSVYYYKNNSLINKNTTDSKGKYCISLPEIKSSEKYDIFIEYENSTDNPLQLASNDYTLGFDNNKIFNKTIDKFVFLTGKIINKDAEIENGRVEIKVGYLDPLKNNSVSYRYGDYQKFYNINIDSNEEYEVTEESGIFWEIPIDSTPVGKYKILIKASFNAKEKTSYVYFNITN